MPNTRNGRVEITAFVQGPGDEYTKCTSYVDAKEWEAASLADKQAMVVRQAHEVIDRLPASEGPTPGDVLRALPEGDAICVTYATNKELSAYFDLENQKLVKRLLIGGKTHFTLTDAGRAARRA